MSRRDECAGKRAHLTWTDAARVAKGMRQRWHRVYDVYGCRFCHRFHVGT